MKQTWIVLAFRQKIYKLYCKEGKSDEENSNKDKEKPIKIIREIITKYLKD